MEEYLTLGRSGEHHMCSVLLKLSEVKDREGKIGQGFRHQGSHSMATASQGRCSSDPSHSTGAMTRHQRPHG